MPKYQYQIVANENDEATKRAKQTVCRGIVEGDDIHDINDQIASVAFEMPGEVVQITTNIFTDNCEA